MYFNEFWMTNLRKYEHIIYAIPVAQCLIAPHFSWCHLYLILTEIKVSLNRNGLIFKKVTSEILNEYHRFQWTRCRHFHKWHVTKIRGPHWVTLHKYKATWTSLLINENSKSTFTTQLRHPLTWALLLVLFQKLHDG
jgi:ABC-type sugar transport system permease subunit